MLLVIAGYFGHTHFSAWTGGTHFRPQFIWGLCECVLEGLNQNTGYNWGGNVGSTFFFNFFINHACNYFFYDDDDGVILLICVTSNLIMIINYVMSYRANNPVNYMDLDKYFHQLKSSSNW